MSSVIMEASSPAPFAFTLYFMHYNFARPHKTLTPKASIGVTPAMVSGVANRIWTIEDIVKLAD